MLNSLNNKLLRMRATLVAFVILNIAVFPIAAEAEDGLLSKWRFGPEHIEDKTVKSEYGDLGATIIGPLEFSEDEPKTLLLPGNVKEKHRIQINVDVVAEIKRTLAGDTDAILPKKDFMVEAWVRVDRPQPWGGIIGCIQDNGNYERGWQLGYTQMGFYLAVSTPKKNRLTYLTSRTVYAPGYWYHVVGTYDGKETRIYLDGRLEGVSKDQAGNIAYAPKGFFTIGAYHDDNELNSLAGQIGEISLYRRAMSAKEIQARFEASKHLFPGVVGERLSDTDWPTYMHDNQRTGITNEKLQFPLKLKWVYRARHAPRPAWPPPAKQDFWHNKKNLNPRVIYDRAFHVISVNDRVYFGSSADDKVYCLDLKTGRELWSFYPEGPVRLAPTITEGKLLFGSDDGHVYCLDAITGEFQWKLRIGPSDRRISGNERIISLWPVRTGVLVDGNIVHACAGIFPTQGVHQVAADIQTGKKVASGRINVSAQGYTARRGGRLYIATGRVAAGTFVSMLERRGKDIPREARNIPAEYPYAFIGAADVRIGGGDCKVAAFSVKDASQVWQVAVEGKAYSLAVARGRLLVSTDAGHIYCFTADAAAPVTIEPRPNAGPADTGKEQKRHEKTAKWIVEETGITKGYCLIFDSSEGRLAYELLRLSELKIVCIETDPAAAIAARKLLDTAGLYGRAVVHQLEKDGQLPYTDYMFNLVVANGKHSYKKDEIMRVLRPHGGAAVLGRSDEDILRRGPLEGFGEWTHFYADPANTGCSGDQRVGSQMALQWFGRPGPRQMIDRHHRTSPPLWKNGRLFIPGNDRIIAADAYNGTLHWNVEIPNSRRVAAFKNSGYMAVTGDRIYVAAASQCIGLNVSTGKEESKFQVESAPDGKERDWGYIAVVDDLLFGSGTKPGASIRELSRRAVDNAYYDFRPVVTSDYLFAINRKTGAKGWSYLPQSGPILNPTITIGGGKVFFVESAPPESPKLSDGRAHMKALLGQGSRIVALDMQTGKTAWSKSHDLRAIEHNVYISYARDLIAVVGSRNNRTTKTVFFDLYVFDAKSGELKWTHSQNNQRKVGGGHGEQDLHPVIVGDRLYCEPNAYNLETGEPLKGWGWTLGGRSGCGTLSASASALFFRNSNPTMFDLVSKSYSKLTTVTRPGCWINLIPAGGLLLAPEASSGCTCNFAIQTSMAFLPVGQPKGGK